MGILGLTYVLEKSNGSSVVDLIAESKRVRTEYEAAHKRQTTDNTQINKQSNQSLNTSCERESNNQIRSDESVDHLETIERAIERHKGKLLLAVDGVGFLFELASTETIAGRWLPAYDLLHRRLVSLIECLRAQSIELVVYFDAPSSELTKQSTNVKRNSQRKDDVRAIADELSFDGLSVTSLTPLVTSLADSESCLSQSFQLVQAQCLCTFKMMNVSTILCEEEADMQLSHDARTFNQAIYGILSNDSDCAAMIGCKWIPTSSLVLQWGDLIAAESLSRRDNQLVVTPTSIDHLMEALYSEERSRASFSPSTVKPSRSFFNQRYLTGVRCRVWTPEKVANELGLSTPKQLVDFAILAGNDYTKEFVPSWQSAACRSSTRCHLQDVVSLLTHPANRHKRLSEMPTFRELFAKKDVDRAVRLSMRTYEGVDFHSQYAQDTSLIVGVDGAIISAHDISQIRTMLAGDKLPSETLSIIARDLINVTSYPEGSPSSTRQGSNDPRELWLPETEKTLRFLHSSFALLCGRRTLRLVHVDAGKQTIEKRNLAQTLPLLTATLTSLVESNTKQLPLLVVRTLPLADRLIMFSQSLSATIDPVIDNVLRNDKIPLWLRFPAIHFRSWNRVLTDSFGVHPLALKPWLESLNDMRTFLHAVRNDQTGNRACHAQPFRTIILQGGLMGTSPPMMTAVNLFTQYQASWDQLRSLVCAFDLPADLIGYEAPMHSMHGPLFLLFVQDNLDKDFDRVRMSAQATGIDRLKFITRSIKNGKITVEGLTQEALLSRVQACFASA